jgi:hypothetical protein
MSAGGSIINENQRRAVSITLGLLDEMLCRCEEWARGREAHSVLYEEHNSLSSRDRDALLAEIGRIRPIIERLKEALGLYSRTCSAAVDIWSRSAAARETLMEIEHLSGYGDVHPNLKRLLAENVPLLLEGLDRVTAVIGSKRRQP